MFASDFSTVTSVHQLLWQLFEAEMGVRAVISPATQRQILRGSYSRLRNIVSRQSADCFELQCGDRAVPVAYAEDAVLLSRLYSEFSKFSDDELLPAHVYPLIGKFIDERPVFSARARDLLASHIERWGPGVGDRILKDLPRFGLESLVPELRPVVAFSVVPQRCA